MLCSWKKNFPTRKFPDMLKFRGRGQLPYNPATTPLINTAIIDRMHARSCRSLVYFAKAFVMLAQCMGPGVVYFSVYCIYRPIKRRWCNKKEKCATLYTSFIHCTTAVEKINEQQIQLHKRTNNTNAHQRIKH